MTLIISQGVMLGIFLLLLTSHLLGSNFHTENTHKLKQHLTLFEEKYADIDNKPDGIEELWQKVTELILLGADPCTITDHHRASALHFAAIIDKVDGIEFLVKQGLDTELTTKNRRTPLFLAAVLGNVLSIKKLLAHSANIEATIANSETPLMFAARHGQALAVIKLLAFRATKGKEAFLQAVGNAKEVLSAFFSDANALANEHLFHSLVRRRLNEELEHSPIPSSMDSANNSVNELNAHGFTALDIALVTSNQEAFLLLLKKGADPTIGRFAPRSLKASLHCLSYDYAFNFYWPILEPLFEIRGLPSEIIKHVIDVMLLPLKDI